MAARLTALLLWAVAAATAVAWGLRLGAQAQPVPPQAVTAGLAPPVLGDLSRLLGSAPPPPPMQEAVVPADSRFKLLGVVAPRAGQTGSGLALISVDGKPARAVGVGREVEPGLRVLRVDHRQVELGGAAGTPALSLSLPALAEAARGRLTEGAVALGVPGSALAPAPGMARPPVFGTGMPPAPRPAMGLGIQGGPAVAEGDAQQAEPGHGAAR